MTLRNTTLARQLRRLKLDESRAPNHNEWLKLLQYLDSHYSHIDDDRNMLARSLELATEEMSRVQLDVEQERNQLRSTIDVVQRAVSQFSSACQHARASGGEDCTELTRSRSSFNLQLVQLLSEFSEDSGQSKQLLSALRVSFIKLFEEVISMVNPSEAVSEEITRMHRALIPPRWDERMDRLRLTVSCQQLQDIGGDLWSSAQMPGGEHFFCVADATGHGPTAGFMTAAIAAALRAVLTTTTTADLHDLLSRLDTLVEQLGQQHLLLTLCAVVVDRTARTATFINAGHVFPIVLREGHARAIDARGNPLGTGSVSGLRVGRAQLRPGDRLVLYTDGVTEVQNPIGVDYGERFLRRALERAAHQPSQQLIDTIWRDVDAYRQGAPLHDDRTMLVLTIH